MLYPRATLVYRVADGVGDAVAVGDAAVDGDAVARATLEPAGGGVAAPEVSASEPHAVQTRSAATIAARTPGA